MARRKLHREKKEEPNWEALIIRALHNSAHTSRWGCLDRKGKLFTTLDFKYRNVPMHVVDKMVQEKALLLCDTGFYEYVVPKPKRKKRKLNG